ncbi:MAG: diguanylate cyclase [Pseudomonadota bacterium]
MNIQSLITTCARDAIISVGPDAGTRDAAQLLRNSDIGALLVTDQEDRIVGMLSERDLVRGYAESGAEISQVQVRELMTPDVITCSGEDDVIDVMAILHDRHIRHIPVVEQNRPIAMLSLRDFEHACKELQHLALTDPLTGLANRRAFFETLNREIERHRRFDGELSLALLDLDHFKAINDKHGHDAGDQVLCSFARILLSEFRVFDAIARIGGEEFALLFPQTSLADASRACERILETVRRTVIPTDVGDVTVTFSAGLTRLHADETSAKDMLKRADGYLYDAKRAGRNRLSAESIVSVPPTNLTIAAHGIARQH